MKTKQVFFINYDCTKHRTELQSILEADYQENEANKKWNEKVNRYRFTSFLIAQILLLLLNLIPIIIDNFKFSDCLTTFCTLLLSVSIFAIFVKPNKKYIKVKDFDEFKEKHELGKQIDYLDKIEIISCSRFISGMLLEARKTTTETSISELELYGTFVFESNGTVYFFRRSSITAKGRTDIEDVWVDLLADIAYIPLGKMNLVMKFQQGKFVDPLNKDMKNTQFLKLDDYDRIMILSEE